MARTGIEQGRASLHLKRFLIMEEGRSEEQKNYKSYLKRLPALIQTNGLGQALVFYYSEKVFIMTFINRFQSGLRLNILK